jgi:uncharacterized membrane protein
MPSLYQLLLIVHIVSGTTGLLSGTLAAIVKKGSSAHKVSGQFFFWGMLLASIAALVLSNLPEHHNLFLFAVGGFTLYMIVSGYRVIFAKRNAKIKTAPNYLPDYVIQLLGVLFGGFLLWMGIKSLLNEETFGIVPIVFGVININFARVDFQLIYSKKPIQSFWMRNHIVRMMGGMIASYTAFLVVNIKIQPNWILWLAPSLIGSLLITYFIIKFVPVKKLPNL